MDNNDNEEEVIKETPDTDINDIDIIEDKVEIEEENNDLQKSENIPVDEDEIQEVYEILPKEDIKEDDNKNDMIISPKKEGKKSAKILLIIIISVILALVITFGIIICINKVNTKVYKNVFIENIDLSKKNDEEVLNAVKQSSENINNNESIDIYQQGEKIFSIKAQDIDLKFDINKTVDRIMSFGRDKNIFTNNINIIKALFKPVHIDPAYEYNNEKLEDIIKNIDLSLKDRYVDDSYSLDEKNNKLIIVNGKTGNSIDYETEKTNILKCLEGNYISKYELKVLDKKPKEVDVNEVYSKIKRDAKDAYVDKSTEQYKFIAEVVGYDFDVEQLKQLLEKSENKEEGKTIGFSLTVIEPKVKLSDINYTLYNDKLAGYTTYFPTNMYARNNNLKIALSYMNGTIVMPGETYSYNKNIGETTESKGYLPASTFKGGKSVDEVGGGICQTVSTLYNTVLYANLEVVERHQHGLPVGYVPPSRDATVYSPVLDFKFKNNRKYPVKIVTSFSSGGSLNVSIYGTKEDSDPEVILSQKTLSNTPFTTKYIYDNTLPKGQQVVVTNGVNGYKSEGYITKKLNGQVISSGVLSRDTYRPQQAVVKIGTAGN